MFPEYITLVLQQLSYLALIIIAPCTVFNTVTNLVLREQLKNHLDLDDMRFKDMNQHLGKHDSLIDDLRVGNASSLASYLDTILQEVKSNKTQEVTK